MATHPAPTKKTIKIHRNYNTDCGTDSKQPKYHSTSKENLLRTRPVKPHIY